MRLIPVLAVLLVPALVAAQDPVTADPSHHIVEIDNPQVRVFRTTLGPREKTIAHDHPAGVAVFLTDSTYRIGSGKGTPREESVKRGDVRLMPAGIHTVENLGTSPSEMLMVELKTPALTPWKELTLDAVKVDPHNFKVISENEQVRVLHSTAKAPAVQHEHPPYVYVLISGGSGTPGAVQYRPAARHAPVNDGVNIMIELRTRNPAPAK